jgi:hypothetical protein
MKNLLFYISFLSLLITTTLFSTGCNDASTVPAFVRIDTIIVDSTNYNYHGNLSPKVDFAWVYVNDNLQGVYKLPCKFPVIGNGPTNIKIYAGVYDFGNSTSATRYLFYQPYTINDTLVVEDTLVLQPHVKYDTTEVFAKIFDFDGGAFPGDFVYSAGSGVYSNTYAGGYEGQCAAMLMGPSDTTNFVIETATAIYVPKNGVGYFVELTYKCNCPFYFDIKTSSAVRSIIGFNTHSTWNKAYINLTYPIDVTPGTDVKLVFKMVRDANIPNQEVLIDDIKLIYQP